MAADGDNTKVPLPDDLSDIDTTDSSDVEDNVGAGETPTNEEPKEVEWLATSRAKRSTAGNRMKAMLANEEPAAEDSDLELLFAEDEDDAGFTDVEKEDASDVQMDSSSDDEDQENAGDDDEGEKELERQNKEKRKRKAQDAIPAKFRKKVRIEQPPTAAGSASPNSTAVVTPRPPRPKKKSERTSWLPSPADLPTRASERSTTRISKQQLHQKMVSDEIRRQKQIERMEKKAKLLEASKKPPMTQEQRLAEAALVEKRNSKSLNRWEEAEKQREEERLRKIAALNNRKLDGPVVTFWSGIQELSEAQSNHVGNLVSMEVKAPRKKRQSAAAILAAKEAGVNGEPATPITPATPGTPAVGGGDAAKADVSDVKVGNTDAPSLSATPAPVQTQGVPPVVVPKESSSAPPPIPTATDPPASVPAPAPIPMAAPVPIPSTTSLPSSSTPAATSPAPMAPPPIPPPPADTRPPSTSGVLAAPVLAPPVGITPPILGTQMTMLGFAPPNAKSNILALPNTTHTPSPLSLPPSTPAASTKPQPPPIQTNMGPAGSMSSPSPKTVVPPPPLPSAVTATPVTPATPFRPTQGKASATPQTKPPDTPVEPPSATATVPPPSATDPPREGKVTRSCIILQNFDEAAIKDKQVQTQILFGRKMNRLAKPSQPPLCVITNHPAKYRDPKTGLPYYNSYAYREIQRVHRGDYKWSSLLGAYVGRGDCTARGVPDRFKDASKGLPVERRREPKLVPIEGAEEVKPEKNISGEKKPVDETPKIDGGEKPSVEVPVAAPVTAAPAPAPTPASTPAPAPTCTPTPTAIPAAPEATKV
ncbi:YL1 nuclear protein-domain-containing protein [Podospora fimiseda]|uniref:YL1 nuclear protein-domain-containing protein n=1 Tax=Podospora fimiseda TaxID=252190 RepID=A0AAN7BWQ2_9PEZI|nr:YL1 nuclear protein-domain-containing protein [Podospora fimiseda]